MNQSEPKSNRTNLAFLGILLIAACAALGYLYQFSKSPRAGDIIIFWLGPVMFLLQTAVNMRQHKVTFLKAMGPRFMQPAVLLFLVIWALVVVTMNMTCRIGSDQGELEAKKVELEEKIRLKRSR